MNKHISYSLYVLHALLALSYTMLSAYELDTFYGKVSFEDPLLIKLVEHKSMQRLKHINQYGLRSFAYKQHNYSRYEHSIGVFALLKILFNFFLLDFFFVFVICLHTNIARKGSILKT
jgi:predicted class III extradiol MEMO1 family dioxygenase